MPRVRVWNKCLTQLTCQRGRPGMMNDVHGCPLGFPNCWAPWSRQSLTHSGTKSVRLGPRAAYICVTGVCWYWWMWGRFYIWITYSPTPVRTWTPPSSLLEGVLKKPHEHQTEIVYRVISLIRNSLSVGSICKRLHTCSAANIQQRLQLNWSPLGPYNF